MTEELKGKLAIDITDFKSAISTVNREMRVVESGFNAAAAELGNWSKSADGLQMRMETLTDKIGLQQIKVDALLSEYTRLAAEKGENSTAAKEMEIKLNNEEAALSKLKNELKNNQTALEGMGSESADAAKKVETLDRSQEKAADSGSKMSAVMGGLGAAVGAGVTAIAALATAAAAAAAGMAALVVSSANAAGELVDASNKTGISVERLQELAFIGDQVGVSTETISGSLAQLTRNMDAARDGSDKQAEAFKTLGVNVTDAEGNLRNADTVMQEVFTALGGMSNETERDALAMELFGRSAMELNPLIKTSASEMDALRQQAHDLGAVVGTDTVNRLESFGDMLGGLKAGLAGTGMEIAAALLPGFEQIAGKGEQYLGQLSAAVKGADGDLSAMVAGVGGVLADVAGDLAKSAPQMLMAGLGIIQGIITAIIAALPTLIPAAVEILTSLVGFLVQNLPLLIQAGVDLLLALINGILPMLPMLVEAAIQIIITLANGLSAALPKLIPAVVAIIPQIILALLENLPMLIQAAVNLIIALATGLVQAIPVLLPYIPQIVQAIFDAVVASLPIIYQAAFQIIITLVTGMWDMLPLVGETGLQLIDVIRRGVMSYYTMLFEIGKSIVTGIYQGIEGLRDWFYNNVLNFFGNMINQVKKSLGIQSPSTVFAEMGENMALGLGLGFEGAFARIARDISGAVSDLAGTGMQLAGAGSAARGRGSAGTVQITVNAVVADEIDIDILGQRLVEWMVGQRS